MKAIQRVVPRAIRLTTATAIARILSTGLSVAAREGWGRTAGAAAVGRCAIGAGPDVRGAGAAGAEAGAGVPGSGPWAPVGPPGGKVGNLIVGAADGLGGRLIRTVSFFG